jgi:hypothetical protein
MTPPSLCSGPTTDSLSKMRHATGFSICYVYARKDEALRSSYMTHAEAVVIAEAIAKLPEIAKSVPS